MNAVLPTYSTNPQIDDSNTENILPTLRINISESGSLFSGISISEDNKLLGIVTQPESVIKLEDDIFGFFGPVSSLNYYSHGCKVHYSGAITGQYRYNLLLHQKVLRQIDELLTKEYDWDSIGYEKPNSKGIDYAKHIMSDFMFSINSAGYSLEEPVISNCENGGATIEWRENEKSLYLDIKHQSAKVTKVWKEGKNTIVRTDNLHERDYVSVWEWIINE